MMETVPLICDGETIGQGHMDSGPLYIRLYIRIPYRAGLWGIWAVGDTGEVRVGIPEPEGRELVLTRRLSLRTLAPAGPLLHLELRRHGPGVYPPRAIPRVSSNSAARNHPPWDTTSDSAVWNHPPRDATSDSAARRESWETVRQIPLHTEILSRQLPRDIHGALQRREGIYTRLAFPWDTDAPFPLPGLFCLARIHIIAGRTYCVFTFDDREEPVL